MNRNMLTFFFLATAMWAQNNPTAAETDSARRNYKCRDPWVSLAVVGETGLTPVGSGDEGQCAAALYNGGSWASYAQLRSAVQETFRSLRSQGVSFALLKLPNNDIRVALTASNPSAFGRVVAVGGANVIATGGANVIATGGANVIATGGANLASLPVIRVSAGYQTQSSGVIALPRSAIVLR